METVLRQGCSELILTHWAVTAWGLGSTRIQLACLSAGRCSSELILDPSNSGRTRINPELQINSQVDSRISLIRGAVGTARVYSEWGHQMTSGQPSNLIQFNPGPFEKAPAEEAHQSHNPWTRRRHAGRTLPTNYATKAPPFPLSQASGHCGFWLGIALHSWHPGEFRPQCVASE